MEAILLSMVKAAKALTAMVLPVQPLHKPIFLVGCAKSGTTMLGLLLSFHPDVGPKNPILKEFEKPQDFLDIIATPKGHSKVAPDMEEKPLWDTYFPINGVEFRMGKELVLLKNPLGPIKTSLFKKEIVKNFYQRRFFSKQPFNSFRVHVLREMFPDAKILAIHRDGRDVVSSWGKEADRWEKLGGFDKGIPIFARKWNETVSHIEDHKDELDIYTFKYEDFVEDPILALKKIFDFCNLEFIDSVYRELILVNKSGKWKVRIPEEFHSDLNRLTGENLQRLGYKV